MSEIILYCHLVIIIIYYIYIILLYLFVHPLIHTAYIRHTGSTIKTSFSQSITILRMCTIEALYDSYVIHMKVRVVPRTHHYPLNNKTNDAHMQSSRQLFHFGEDI